MREQKYVGRPREFDENDVLIKMMNLFWEKGYEGVSLSDIMTATGLQKGSLYKAFNDKRTMYVKSVHHYERLVVDGAVRDLKAQSDAYGRLNAFMTAPIDSVRSNSDRRGCFLCNASADQSALDSETGKMVQRGFKKLENALKWPLRDLLPNASASAIDANAGILLALYAGLRVMVRSGMPVTNLIKSKDAALKMVTR